MRLRRTLFEAIAATAQDDSQKWFVAGHPRRRALTQTIVRQEERWARAPKAFGKDVEKRLHGIDVSAECQVYLWMA